MMKKLFKIGLFSLSFYYPSVNALEILTDSDFPKNTPIKVDVDDIHIHNHKTVTIDTTSSSPSLDSAIKVTNKQFITDNSINIINNNGRGITIDKGTVILGKGISNITSQNNGVTFERDSVLVGDLHIVTKEVGMDFRSTGHGFYRGDLSVDIVGNTQRKVSQGVRMVGGGRYELDGKVFIQTDDNLDTVQAGIFSRGGSHGIFNDKVTLRMGKGNSVSYKYGHGIMSGDMFLIGTRAYLDFNNGVDVAVKDDHGVAAYAFNGELNIKGDTTLYSPNTSVQSEYNGILTIDGKTNIKGDVVAKSNSNIKLKLHDNSVLSGAILEQNSYIKLDMTNSHWSANKDSNFTDLIAQNSVIDYQGQYHTNIIKNLAGNSNTFKMRTDVAKGSGDLLEITNISQGSHYLKVANLGSVHTNGTETQTLVKTADGQANFTSNQVEQGGYLYDLKKAGNNWQLSGTQQITSTADAAANIVNANYLLNQINNQSIFTRFNELKNTPDHHFWLKTYTGKSHSSSNAKLASFNMDYYGLQTGIDAPITDNLYLGTMLGYTDASPDFKAGSGKSKSYHLGLYGSYLADNGLTINGQIKYSKVNNRFTVKDTLSQSINGKNNSQNYQALVDVSKQFLLSDTNFYIEPHMQASYTMSQFNKVKASNGLNIKLNNYRSIITKTGLTTGYQLKERFHFYTKLDYIKEWAGKSGYKLHNSKEKLNLKNSGLETTLGVSTQFNQHHIFGEIALSKNNHFTNKQLNLGYRYLF